LVDVVSPLGGEGTELGEGWRLRSVSLEPITNLITQAQDIISARGNPVPEAELATELVRANLPAPLGGTLADARVVLGLLGLSRQIRRNTYGEWGLSHWETVTPKRMNDKIYLA
jgi:hypothetical protein